jgi:hypothetical protein
MNSKDKLKRLNRLKQINQKLKSNLVKAHIKQANNYLYGFSVAYQLNEKNNVLTTSPEYNTPRENTLVNKINLVQKASKLFALNQQSILQQPTTNSPTEASDVDFFEDKKYLNDVNFRAIEKHLQTYPLFQHQALFRFLFFPLLLVNQSIDEIDQSFADRVRLLKETQALLNMLDNKLNNKDQSFSFNDLRNPLKYIKNNSHDKKNIFIDLLESFLLIIDNIFQFIVGLVLLFPNKIGLIESHYVGTFKHLLDCIINVLIQTVRLITAVLFPIHMLDSKFTTNSFNSIKHENERIIESMNEILNELDPTHSDDNSSDEGSSVESDFSCSRSK